MKPPAVVVTQEHRDYLEWLRASGQTNMLGAGLYLQRKFGVDEQTATGILAAWMRSKRESARENK